MTTPYGLDVKVLESYISLPHPSLWTRIKFRLFGKQFVEYEGPWRIVFWVYKDQLFLTEVTRMR